MESVGFKVKKIRELKNISQSYIAQKLAISQSAYSELENGKTKVTIAKLNEIALALEVDIETIKTFNEETVLYKPAQTNNSSSINGNNQFETINQLYQQLLNEKELRIKQYEELIKVKEELMKKLGKN